MAEHPVTVAVSTVIFGLREHGGRPTLHHPGGAAGAQGDGITSP